MPGGSAINGREIEIEIEQTRARLAANEVERRALEAELKDLLSRQATKSLETVPRCSVWVARAKPAA